jgi:DNA-binding protein HU-beta
MTKAETLSKVSKRTGIEKVLVQKSVEGFLDVVRDSLTAGEPIFVRGFGSFILKKRAKKIARNIRKNTSLVVPEHYIVSLKPVKSFADDVKKAKVSDKKAEPAKTKTGAKK